MFADAVAVAVVAACGFTLSIWSFFFCDKNGQCSKIDYWFETNTMIMTMDGKFRNVLCLGNSYRSNRI